MSGSAAWRALACATLFCAAHVARGADSAGAIEQGSELYKQYCESCHGRDMATSSPLVFDLRKFPKNEAQRFRASVLNGKGGMPAWRETLADEDLANLWAYVQSGGAKP